MLIGVCQIELFIHASSSLKEKRFVVKSLKDKISNRFNVSVAEVDHLDKWQRASLGLATVTNEHKIIDHTFSEIIKLIESNGEAEVISRTISVY
jgi:uncharacterized protein